MKKQEEAGKQVQQTQQFVLTTSQKVQILDDVMKSFLPSMPLAVCIDHQGIKQKDQDSMHIYNIHFSKQVRKTQNSNLYAKINEFSKLQNDEKQTIKENAGEKSEEEDNEIINTNYRFFQNNVICFRCKKQGHYRQMCPQSYSCLFCLSFQHNSDRCPQRNVCYRCYNIGHMIEKCPMKQNSQKCSNCDRSHTGQCHFLTKGTERMKKMFHTESLANHPDICCPKCLKYGHIDC